MKKVKKKGKLSVILIIHPLKNKLVNSNKKQEKKWNVTRIKLEVTKIKVKNLIQEQRKIKEIKIGVP